MNKKGFTLVELLAVLVILAVIALITFPIITNIIKSSKKEAFRLSVNNIKDDIKNYYTKNWLLRDMNDDIVFDFSTNTNLDLLKTDTSIINHGTITLDVNGNILINVDNGTYCVYKDTDSDSIFVGEMVNGSCKLDGQDDSCAYRIGYTWDFDYITTGEDRSQEFNVPCTGNYKLEVWGAEGGNYSETSRGGFGGYSTGKIVLEELDKLYINVGGQGQKCSSGTCDGGYNGGGSGRTGNQVGSSGGGATHIAFSSGLLTTFNPALENSKFNDLLIVAGGGGGTGIQGTSLTYLGSGGSGGGIVGNNGTSPVASYDGVYGGTGGTQSSGGTKNNGGLCGSSTGYQTSGTFGQGGSVGDTTCGGSGAGGGYYGGGGAIRGHNGAGGGSGYIGNNDLKSKYMYCYNCTTSIDESTFTVTGTSVSDTAVSVSAKQGNGYARITYLGKNEIQNVIACTSGMSWTYNYKTENGSGVSQLFTPACNGYYKIELWGAQGGSAGSGVGGKGAYTSGIIELNTTRNLYVYVGEYYPTYRAESSFNGGGHGSYGTSETTNGNGGGATDIRLVSGSWDDFDSLKSRIMVAAGGGGATGYKGGANGGAGGDLEGNSGFNYKMSGGSSIYLATGGSQTSGGFKAGPVSSASEGLYGTFGKGGEIGYYTGEGMYYAGGGGGYYGGGAGGCANANVGSAAGGSSFVSGYPGCNAISESSTSSNIVHTNQEVHYSGLQFSSPVMLSGGSSMPTHDGESVMVGNSGSGYAKITYVGDNNPNTCDTLVNTTWIFNYVEGNNKEQDLTLPCSGVYKLEVWGAQGGTPATYNTTYASGGYSVGSVTLEKNTKLYINVGGQGSSYSSTANAPGGYNGGGDGGISYSNGNAQGGSGGGGATHIALSSGVLSSLSSKKNDVLIVAGGGGGTTHIAGGDGGGYIGNDGGYTPNYPQYHATGATQDAGGYDYQSNGSKGTFGQGSNKDSGQYGGNGGGGGWYGGGGSNRNHSGGGAGSGYIGYNYLKNKYMYCYNCTTTAASEVNIYTKSDGINSCVSDTPMQDCAKKSNGYARITYLGKINSSAIYVGKVWNYTYSEKNGDGYPYTFTVPVKGIYKIELWGAQGASQIRSTGDLIGGKGAYTSGEIELESNKTFYIYVGGAGETYAASGSTVKKPYGTYNFNGASGGNYTCYDYYNGKDSINLYAGSATDIRLVNGAWDNTASLASRIMVAAGGAAANETQNGAPGGALNGKSGGHGTGATQTSGGSYGGTFGKAGYPPNGSNNCWNSTATGASSGYYGGGAYRYNSTQNGQKSAGSGSSYISGYQGCVAIKGENDITKKDGCDDGTTNVECSYHYSGRKFSSPIMKAGDELMPNHDGGVDVVGNSGNGYARITLLEIK